MFISGDMNAHIKDFCDYILDDNLDCMFGSDILYPDDYFYLARRSKDENHNSLSLSLIEMYRIHVLNGRLFKNQQGEYTFCQQWRKRC